MRRRREPMDAIDIGSNKRNKGSCSYSDSNFLLADRRTVGRSNQAGYPEDEAIGHSSSLKILVSEKRPESVVVLLFIHRTSMRCFRFCHLHDAVNKAWIYSSIISKHRRRRNRTLVGLRFNPRNTDTRKP